MVIHLLSLCVELLEYISSEKKIYNFSQIKIISQKSNVLPEIHFLEDFDFLMKYNFLTQIHFSRDSFSIKNINFLEKILREIYSSQKKRNFWEKYEIF